MKVRISILAWVMVTMQPCVMFAQSLNKAEESYAQFNKARAADDKAAMYNALYHSYEEYAKVLSSSAVNSSSYSVSKQALAEIFRYLPSGAAWSQSKGYMDNCILFAQAYIDITQMEAFKGDMLPKSENHAALANIAAAGAYNSQQYEKAVVYLRAYLETGDQRRREECYRSLVEAYIKLDKTRDAVAAVAEAIRYYPNSRELLELGINKAMAIEDWDNLQLFLDKALAVYPNDLSFLDTQGKLYEKRNDFQKAITVYNKLNKLKPQNLDINKHLALDYYNMGVDYYNKALMEQGSSAEKKYKRQANEYFSAAVPVLENVIANDPTAAGHTTALGIIYNCMGEKDKRDEVNNKLLAFNMQPISDNTIPSIIGGDERVTSHSVVSSSEPMPTDFAQYQKKYVEDHYKQWYFQREFETDEDYAKRVNKETCQKKVDELNVEAEQRFIAQHVTKITHKDLSLSDYDIGNETYMIMSDYGNMIIEVPHNNNEAQIFKSTWVGMQFKSPQFYIDNNYQIRLSSLTFVTPAGKSYRYDRSVKDMAYAPRVHSGDIKIPEAGSRPQFASNPQPQPKKDYASSDVDTNIPETKVVNDRTFAVIISNENYRKVPNVPCAEHDGDVISQYCMRTLGIPEDNIRRWPDATFADMQDAMDDISKIAEADKLKGNLNVLFFYSGHGIPDEKTGSAYLLPTDADGKNTRVCLALNELYTRLNNLNARQVLVFLDACFSGDTRDNSHILDTRGISVKPKPVEAKGNMVVFSAASGDESAMAYKKQNHGLFTYFLLKKLQESKGNVSLKELGDYIIENVSLQSQIINKKTQTPTVKASLSLGTAWEDRPLRPKK